MYLHCGVAQMTKLHIFAPMASRIIILVDNRVQALDVTGPASVFSAANAANPEGPYYQVDVVSPDGGRIDTVSGVALDTQAIGDVDVRGIDTFLIAGHDELGSRALIDKAQAQAWTAEVLQTARRWGSVCSGAFVLAAWGHLAGRHATTHWSGVERLACEFQDIDVDREALFVVDANLWTSAGVTAGIDMALAMVEADLGSDIAATVARHLVVYLRRPGHQSQFSQMLKSQTQGMSPYHGLIEWIGDNLSLNLSIARLAEQAGQSPRTFQRRFSQEMGASPAAYVETVRLERAKALIATHVPLQTIASQIGYPTASQFSIAFRRRFGVSPSVWKNMHSGASHSD